MKTKIIYISGNEIFDMNDIRSAFDKVRAALGLDNDTVLFGVPVDADNAIANIADNDAITVATDILASETIETDIAETIIAPQHPDITPVASDVADTPAETAPVQAPKRTRGRPAKKVIDATPEIASTAITAPDIVPDVSAPVDTPIYTDADATDAVDDAAPVIPILSVLASKENIIDVADDTESDDNGKAPVEQIDIQPDITDTTAAVADDMMESDAEISEIVENDAVDSDIISDDLQQVQLADMVADHAPEAPMEKTLEVLLESMKPLSEDFVAHTPDNDIADDATIEEFSPIMSTNDTDETLQKLAAEFAETEDQIVSVPKVESHGKIGKLKNILPFKKAKRDDGGLMGDLFGWAGIAANDEDFSIPGFFTTAASKK